MRKKCTSLNKETGFYLVYVSVLAIVFLLLLTTSIKIYHTELYVTHSLLEQTEVETIVQMGRAKLKEDKPFKNEHTGTVFYTFPLGTIEIMYNKKSTTELNVQYKIQTNRKNEFILSENMFI